MDYKKIFERSTVPTFVAEIDNETIHVVEANKAFLKLIKLELQEATEIELGEILKNNIGKSSLKKLKKAILGCCVKEKGNNKIISEFKDKVKSTYQFEIIPFLKVNNEYKQVLIELNDLTHNEIDGKKLKFELNKVLKSLKSKKSELKYNAERKDKILKSLVKFTSMDFTERIEIGYKGDELDAIASGLNVLIDELEHHTDLLKEANKELNESNEELDAFAYSVSHDLRTPLRAINGYSEILLDIFKKKNSVDEQPWLQKIITNASRMDTLIVDLFEFSKLGKKNMRKEIIDMNTLVKTVKEEINHEHEIEYIIHELPNVFGDYKMMYVALRNLISNAIKYSSKNEHPKIEIGADVKDDHALIYVKDNGVGFDMKYHDKMFGVFQRLHSTSEFEGTGIGLALVNRILKKHKGKIWAESEIDKGAKFTFSIPNMENDQLPDNNDQNTINENEFQSN